MLFQLSGRLQMEDQKFKAYLEQSEFKVYLAHKMRS